MPFFRFFLQSSSSKNLRFFVFSIVVIEKSKWFFQIFHCMVCVHSTIHRYQRLNIKPLFSHFFFSLVLCYAGFFPIFFPTLIQFNAHSPVSTIYVLTMSRDFENFTFLYFPLLNAVQCSYTTSVLSSLKCIFDLFTLFIVPFWLFNCNWSDAYHFVVHCVYSLHRTENINNK